MNINCAELEIFKGIDLQDSFVLQWRNENNNIIFDIEASIWPESKYYQAPKEDEYTCYRAALLIFSGIHSVEGLMPLDTVKPFKDANNSMDYGNIETLVKTNNGFELSGEFGNVVIHGGELRFEIYT